MAVSHTIGFEFHVLGQLWPSLIEYLHWHTKAMDTDV